MKSFLDPKISSLIPMSSDVFMFINFARVSCAQKHCCLISNLSVVMSRSILMHVPLLY